jgi:hypothetical protein
MPIAGTYKRVINFISMFGIRFHKGHQTHLACPLIPFFHCLTKSIKLDPSLSVHIQPYIIRKMPEDTGNETSQSHLMLIIEHKFTSFPALRAFLTTEIAVFFTLSDHDITIGMELMVNYIIGMTCFVRFITFALQ